MRAGARWVAAILLVALAFTGGPDLLDAGPHARATVVAGETEPRDPQVRDDALASPHQVIDRGTPRHLRLVALPPSPHTAAPAPVRGALPMLPPVEPHAHAGVSGPPRPGARTPEALQIFRC
jgi:hypothetical protein